jgi:tetratricopeptide (TPR) repeat protein
MDRVLRFIVLSAFGALVLSGFQCASADVTSARNAMKKSDWEGAKVALDRAIAKDSNSQEALTMLGEVNARRNDVPGMVQAYRKAQASPSITKTQSNEVSLRLYNAWIGEYNEAITSYNEAGTSGDRTKYTATIERLKTAFEIKPEFPEQLALLGSAQEAYGDTSGAISTYTRWWNAESAGFDVASSKGVTLGMKRSDLLKAMGTPLQMKADTMTDLAIVYKDRFDVGGRDFLVFSALEPGNDDAAVDGWTYAPPASLSEGEQWRSRTISLAPLKALAFVAYQRDNNEEALAWCDRVAKAKPLDNDLTPLRTELYARTGKSDEAMANLKAEIERNPANTGNRVQYAGMLMNQERFEDAIAQYEAALKAEPNNETALFNMAAVYKNRAVKAQMAERAKQQADRKYQPDESYMKDLGTSADYFVKLRQNFKYRDDLTVLEQLANIYEVRREKVRVKEIIMELEALREKYANDRKYYQIMEGVYARNGMEDKAKEMEQKLGTMK